MFFQIMQIWGLVGSSGQLLWSGRRGFEARFGNLSSGPRALPGSSVGISRVKSACILNPRSPDNDLCVYTMVGHVKVCPSSFGARVRLEVAVGKNITNFSVAIQRYPHLSIQHRFFPLGPRTVTVFYGLYGSVIRLPYPCRCCPDRSPVRIVYGTVGDRPNPFFNGRQRH